MTHKECPSCGAEVPRSAQRCKACFHDFENVGIRRPGGPIFLLGALAAMSVVGSFTLWFVTSAPLEERILVDQESQSIVWTRKKRGAVETDRVRFVDISKLEYVTTPTRRFEIVAVTRDGERHVVKESQVPMVGDAEKYAHVIAKPLEQVDHSSFLSAD